MGLPKERPRASVGNRADVPKWEPLDRTRMAFVHVRRRRRQAKVLPGRLADHSVSQ